MHERNQQGISNIILIAQPQNKFPIISKKALKQGRIETGKTIGIWLTDIGKNLYDSALSMDSNARISLEKYFNPTHWTIRVDSMHLSFRFSLKQYYVPMKAKGMEPFAMRIEFPIQSSSVTDFLRLFLANYNAPPYNFTKLPSLEKTYNTYYETIRNNWDYYFLPGYTSISKPIYNREKAIIDPKKQEKIGDWFKGSKVIKWVPNAMLLIVLSFVIIGPVMSYSQFSDDMEIFLLSTTLQLLFISVMFLLIVIPFRNIWNNYRVGYDRRGYEKLPMETFQTALKEVLIDLNLKYSVQENYLLSRIFRDKVTFISLENKNLDIMYKKYTMGLDTIVISVGIGKVDYLNEKLVLDFEKRLDEKLVNHIRTINL